MIDITYRILRDTAKVPAPAEGGVQIADLFWCPEPTDEHIITAGFCVRPFKTGLAVALPEGYALLLRERKSLAEKGIFLIGGLLHTSHDGEIIAYLMGSEKAWLETTIRPGTAIAQALPFRVEEHQFIETA